MSLGEHSSFITIALYYPQVSGEMTEPGDLMIYPSRSRTALDSDSGAQAPLNVCTLPLPRQQY